MVLEINFTERLAQELNWSLQGIRQAVQLLEEGNTIPFIARYRKEATGEMDEETLRRLAERLEYLQNLAKRKEEVVRLVVNKETNSGIRKGNRSRNIAGYRGLYRPFRPKGLPGKCGQKGFRTFSQLIADQN